MFRAGYDLPYPFGGLTGIGTRMGWDWVATLGKPERLITG